MPLILPLLAALRSLFRSRAALELEILALRHQIRVLRRAANRRPRLTSADGCLWVIPSRLWSDWRAALVIMKPETVIGWHRKGFRLFWGLEGAAGKTGPTSCVARGSRSDPPPEPRELPLRRASHPR
jgi:hypothetical protein